MERFLRIAYAIYVSGCVTYWEKPGGTPQEFDAIQANCSAIAYAQFPVAPNTFPIGNGSNLPYNTTCYGNYAVTNCTTTGGGYVPPMTVVIDINSSARKNAIESCLYQNGWTKTSSGERTGNGRPASPFSPPVPEPSLSAAIDHNLPAVCAVDGIRVLMLAKKCVDKGGTIVLAK